MSVKHHPRMDGKKHLPSTTTPLYFHNIVTFSIYHLELHSQKIPIHASAQSTISVGQLDMVFFDSQVPRMSLPFQQEHTSVDI